MDNILTSMSDGQAAGPTERKAVALASGPAASSEQEMVNANAKANANAIALGAHRAAEARLRKLNPGLSTRENYVYVILLLICGGYFLVSFVIQVVNMFAAQQSPASSVSIKDAEIIPAMTYLVCPHFLFNRVDFHTSTIIRPRVAIVEHDGRGGRTMNFESSEEDKLHGKIYEFTTRGGNRNVGTSSATVHVPASINSTFFQGAASGCIAMTPDKLSREIVTDASLSIALGHLQNGTKQTQVGRFQAGVFCEASTDGGRTWARNNSYCSGLNELPLLISGISLEESDYDPAKSLKWNLEHPCRVCDTCKISDPKFCTAGVPELSRTSQVKAQTQGLISLDISETVPPKSDIWCVSGCDNDNRYFELDLQYISLATMPDSLMPRYKLPQDEMVSTYTIFHSATMASRKRSVLNMYYTSSVNQIISALSGLLSLMVLVVNKLFPKVDQVDRVAPVMVRNAHPLLKKCLVCERRSSGLEQSGGQDITVKNPAAALALENKEDQEP